MCSKARQTCDGWFHFHVKPSITPQMVPSQKPPKQQTWNTGVPSGSPELLRSVC